MVKEVIHDPILLAKKSKKAAIEDSHVAEDLLDTHQNFHRLDCTDYPA